MKHAIRIASLVMIAAQLCAAVGEGGQKTTPRYEVRIVLSSKTCIRCCTALFSVKRAHLGIIGTDLAIKVSSQNAQILKQVRKLVADTNLVRIEMSQALTTPLDTVVVFVDGVPQTHRQFSLEYESLKVLPYLDSLDASRSEITVDTSVNQLSIPLRSRLMFDESSRVHVHDDNQTISIAGNDRAIVVTTDTARTLPQYLNGMDSLQLSRVMLPSRAVVVSPTHVRYRFGVLSQAIDTVINGEMAKLFTRMDSWISDVHTLPTVRNDLRLRTEHEATHGEWASTDSTLVFVPDTSNPDDPVPTSFRFDGYNVDVSARFFPSSVSLCDSRGDTIYSCTPSDGWIRLTKPGTILHMPTPTRIVQSLVLSRCIAIPGGVLLTALDGSTTDRYCSVLVNSNGTRISPVVWHTASTVVAPTLRSGRITLEAIRRSASALHRSTVWQAGP
ncbi:MAG: hypothetical protein FGM32_10745 [Candidatus Kapabacteria bacterium]|nr:hypothetical protein [Candidatus Kapabacteria bacterium]